MKKLLMLLIIPHLLAFVCNAEQEIRGLWAATVFQLDFPSSAGLPPEALKDEIEALVEKTADAGFNALFFQVRPCADAFYESRLFPWSAWLTGTQGKAPADHFDPLTYLTECAHSAGLQLHAWVNPFRVTRNKASSKADALSTLSSHHPAVLNPEWVVFHTDGCLYFDPGLPEVRQLVRAGVREIAENYSVDGIHFDDYFYPGRDFADDRSFSTYGAAYPDRDHFRTASINSLIAGVHSDLQVIRSDLLFGVSPSGIWANSDTDPRGSDTIGYQSKIECYADALAWMEAGTVDYVAPQLYWAIGAREGEFRTLLAWWQTQARRTGTRLLIGLAGYRTAEAEDPASVWYGSSELSRQLTLLRGSGNGYILFRAGSLFDSPAVAACFRQSEAAEVSVPEYWPLHIRWLESGASLQVGCTGRLPTLALWNGQAALLKQDDSSHMTGTIHRLSPGSGPVLYHRFLGSCLLVQVSPGVAAIPEPVECRSFSANSENGVLELTFFMTGPAGATASLSGDQVLLDIRAQRTPLLFETDLLTLDCQPLSPGSRYILTPAFPPKSCKIETDGNAIILRIY